MQLASALANATTPHRFPGPQTRSQLTFKIPPKYTTSPPILRGNVPILIHWSHLYHKHTFDGQFITSFRTHTRYIYSQSIRSPRKVHSQSLQSSHATRTTRQCNRRGQWHRSRCPFTSIRRYWRAWMCSYNPCRCSGPLASASTKSNV